MGWDGRPWPSSSGLGSLSKLPTRFYKPQPTPAAHVHLAQQILQFPGPFGIMAWLRATRFRSSFPPASAKRALVWILE